MKKSMEQRISDLLGVQKRQELVFRLLLMLGCIVVVVTTYAMVLPAITMEGDYICGLEEHIHTQACYTTEESGAQKLTCELQEHQHDEHCLAPEESAQSEYTCGFDYEHTHGERCFVNGKLVCTLEQHRHTAACLPVEQVKQTQSEAEQLDSPEEDGTLEDTAPDDLGSPSENVDETEELADGEQQDQEQLTEDAEQPENEDALTDTDQPEEIPEESEESVAQDPEQTEETEDQSQTVDDPQEAEKPAEEIPPEEQKADEMTTSEDAMFAPFLQATDIPQEVLDAVEAGDRVQKLAERVGSDNITFELKAKISDDEEITIPSGLASSSSEALSYALTVTAYPNNLVRYDKIPFVYYYELDEPGLVLFAGGKQLEKYAESWTTIRESSPTQMKVLRSASNGYIFLFRSVGGTTSELTLGGEARGTRNETLLGGIEKQGELVPEQLAYRYTITSVVPHAATLFDTSYHLEDTTSMGSTRYSGFKENANSLVVKIDNRQIYSIDQVYQDASEKIAYYLDDDGVLWLLNRTEHSSRHLVSEQPVSYDGWCACWQVLDDATLTVEYLDTYARDLYSDTDANNIINNATIRNNHDNSSSAPSTVKNLNQLIRKNYVGQDKQFVLTVNDIGLDLGDTPLQIEDAMENAELDGGVTIVRKTDGDDTGTELQENTDYTLSFDSEKKFTATILEPGSYMYEIRYNVKAVEGGEESLSNNVASIHGANIKKAVGFNLFSSDDYMDARGASFKISLEKIYEGNNPDKGAVFGIYEAATGQLVGRSYTDGDTDSHNKRVIYSVEFDSDMAEDTYVPGAEVDEIWFGSEILDLHEDVPYVIREIEAPYGYALCNEEIYFYATHKDETPEAVKTLEDSGITVKCLNDWTLRTNAGVVEDYVEYQVPQRLYNGYEPYELPETGGHGLQTMQFGGFMSMIVGAVGSFLKKKED